MSLAAAIQDLEAKRDLSEAQMMVAFAAIFERECPDTDIANFLTRLHAKGETRAEVIGAVRYLRGQGVAIKSRHDDLIDCCGTGGDHKNTFNISTAVAFVLAGAGCHVAKHGNRAITSGSGSADVLTALGVKLDVSPESATRCLDEIGIAFLFAPNHYPLLKRVASVRKSLAQRTIFNRLGPLLNPAGAKRQLIGVYDASLTKQTVEILRDLGSTSVVCVHGDDGSDEFTLTTNSHYAELKDAKISEGVFDPRQTGYGLCQESDLLGGTPTENAQRMRLVLKGHSQPLDHAVHINAAWGLLVAGKVDNLMDGLLLAQESISSGAAYKKLEALIAATNS